MKILQINIFPKGVQLRHAEFGTAVRRPVSGETVYLVTCTMDGSGERALVSLLSGTIKHVDQNQLVIPLDAELHVLGDAT